MILTPREESPFDLCTCGHYAYSHSRRYGPGVCLDVDTTCTCTQWALVRKAA